MSRQSWQILSVFGFILLLSRCAQVVPLGGGTKDTTPPLLTEAMPARNSTNFTTDEITLRFNEFVQVKDLSNQLVVTPRLKTAPDVSAEGKKIVIKLKREELAPNTTYRIYLGKAIADMTESNSIPDFEYVFSTGDHVDTLQVKGDVTDAATNKALRDVLVAAYPAEKAADSLLYKKEPDYFTRSGENGTFVLKNLPPGRFLVFAFSDKNKNYLYDGEAEKVAFLGEPLTVGRDTSAHLRLFQEEASKSFVKRTIHPQYGLAQIVLNKKAKVEVKALDPSQQSDLHETAAGKQKDTVAIYYRNIRDTLGLLLRNTGSGKTDTLRLILPKNPKRKLKTFTLNTIGGKLALYDKIRFTFLTWMDTTKSDLSKLKFSSKQDSLVKNMPVKGRWTSITTFELDQQLQEGVNYTLKIDTSAFFDVKQVPNDSLAVNFITQSKIELGKLTLKMLFNKKQAYVVQLINEQEQVVRERSAHVPLSATSAVSIEFTELPPGTYYAKVVFDDNENKKWDSGSLLLRRQPEKVIINSKQLKILADWEIEEQILIKE